MTQVDNVVELIDEQGESIEFEHLMTLDYDEREYIVLRPLDQPEETDEDEVVILRIEQDEDGDDIYVSIEEEEEVNEVLDAFSQILEQD